MAEAERPIRIWGGDESATVVGHGVMTTREVRDMTADERRQAELLALGERGYRIFVASEIDHRYAPWLTTPDGAVWRAEYGEPAAGRNKRTHAVCVERDGSWGFLTAASATGIESAPESVAELKRRRERQERAAREKAAEAKTDRELKRMTARTVTLFDVEPAMRGAPETLRGAVERLDQLGGYVRVTGGRLDVRLPPSEIGQSQYGDKLGMRLARMLYLGEEHVVAATKRNGEIEVKRVPDKPLLPSGALAP